MERIAPLAKILAEANGIDWQQLKGTGDGGMIVEQDILNYLSRIMSGEEEPPATPVDVPPPDWNGDVNAMPDLSGVSADQMARAGVDADLTALLSQAPAMPAPSPEVPATAPAPLDDDLEFELDDAEPSAPTPALPATPATPPLGGWEWSAATPAAAPAVEVPAVQVPQVSAPTVSAPAFQFGAPAAAVPAPAPAAPVAAEPAPAAGLGSLLSRLYQQPAAAAPDPAPAAPQPSASPAFPPPLDTDTADEISGPVLDTGTPAAVVHAPASHEVSVPDIVPPIVTDGPAPVAAPEAVEPAPQPEPVAAAPDTASHADVAAQPEAAPDVAPVAPAATEPAAQHQPAGTAGWSGTYLRRDSNVGALSDLHGQLVAALGQDLPLGLLVARAAQRHAADLGLTSVALHGQDGARSVAGDTLRAAADAAAYAYEGTPDLLVVDAGALDLDDLHFPHTTTLSLGRVQDGRAALSLNGDVDAARGAAFLTAVAQTLGQPVLLLL